MQLKAFEKFNLTMMMLIGRFGMSL